VNKILSSGNLPCITQIQNPPFATAAAKNLENDSGEKRLLGTMPTGCGMDAGRPAAKSSADTAENPSKT